jgi:hypothetical protein
LQVCDEIEHLMDDDDDMAEMYLTEKKERAEAHASEELEDNIGEDFESSGIVSKSAPVSPVGSTSGNFGKLQRAFSSIVGSHKSLLSSSSIGENIDQLEMLLEAYFVVVDNTLSKLSSVRFFLIFLLNSTTCCFIILIMFLCLQLKEYIDDTEDLINIKLVRTDKIKSRNHVLVSLWVSDFVHVFVGECAESVDSVSTASHRGNLCGSYFCRCNRCLRDEFARLCFPESDDFPVCFTDNRYWMRFFVFWFCVILQAQESIPSLKTYVREEEEDACSSF